MAFLNKSYDLAPRLPRFRKFASLPSHFLVRVWRERLVTIIFTSHCEWSWCVLKHGMERFHLPFRSLYRLPFCAHTPLGNNGLICLRFQQPRSYGTLVCLRCLADRPWPFRPCFRSPLWRGEHWRTAEEEISSPVDNIPDAGAGIGRSP